MTSITSTQRLLHTFQASSNRLAEEIRRLSPQDIERAIDIKRLQQIDNTLMNTTVQTHRLIERKILNEQR
jgi:hypothetical protein